MFAINQPKKISLYGRDYVLWKDRSGRISALPNICPHLGAMLSEGWCAENADGTSAVVCPFHALAFDRAGCTVLPGSNEPTHPLLKPLELHIQGDFIWSYGECEPKIPIPEKLNELAANYEFIGYTAETSVRTDLLTMLLNMHDYNHQNGTHRELFQITEVQFEQFIDSGHQSHAFYNNLTAPTTLWEKLKNPGAMLLPDVIKAHLENHFPSLVIFHELLWRLIAINSSQSGVGAEIAPIERSLKNSFDRVFKDSAIFFFGTTQSFQGPNSFGNINADCKGRFSLIVFLGGD